MDATPDPTPAVSSNELHVSSLLVQSRPGQAESVAQRILEMVEAEVPVRNDDKLVVTLTTGSERATLGALETIRDLPGVLFAELVFHSFEPTEEVLR